MSAARYVIEPLVDRHDRAAFSCGVEPLDRYLRQQAGQDLRRDLAAVFVLAEVATNRVAGYSTLSAFTIEPMSLPPALTRRLPRCAALLQHAGTCLYALSSASAAVSCSISCGSSSRTMDQTNC